MITIGLGDLFNIVEFKLRNNILTPTCAIGSPGIGKTAGLEYLVKNTLDFGFKDIRLTTYGAVDIKGIPFPNVEHTAVEWLVDGFLPRTAAQGGTDPDVGVILLDEITAIKDTTVQTAIYQLLNERRLNDSYSLPDGWAFVCFGNDEDDGGDYAGLLAPLRNRVDLFKVEFDPRTWETWAVANGVHPSVVGFLRENPDKFHTYDKVIGDDDPRNTVFATPRSWTRVSDYAWATNDNMFLRRVASGAVPSQIVSTYLAYKEFAEQLPPVADIMSGKVKFDDIDRSLARKAGFILYSALMSNITVEGKKLADEINSAGLNKMTVIQMAAADGNLLERRATMSAKFHSILANVFTFIERLEFPIQEASFNYVRSNSFLLNQLVTVINERKICSDWANLLADAQKLRTEIAQSSRTAKAM